MLDTQPQIPSKSFARARRRRRMECLASLNLDSQFIQPKQVYATDATCNCKLQIPHRKVGYVLQGKLTEVCPIVLYIQLERMWLNFGHEHGFNFEKLMEKACER